MGKGMSRYKFFWQSCKDGNAGVGLLISERWIDRIIDVKRVNERIMCLKVLIGDKLVTCICAYAPRTELTLCAAFTTCNIIIKHQTIYNILSHAHTLLWD